MTNIQALTHPEIHDHEALREFADALADRAVDIERDMAELGKEPGNRTLIADLFRSLHNIKGDAALCKVEIAGLIAHPIESLLTRLRSDEVRYTPLLGELIMLAVDRLELVTEALLAGRAVSHLRLAALVEGLERVSLSSQGDLDPAAAQVVESVTGFRPQANLRNSVGKPPVQGVPQGNMAVDLEFFRSLALQFETRSPLFNGRTGRIQQLVLDTNRAAGSPVDVLQLEAAAYMHDVGMMFLPETVWLKAGNMSDEERRILHTHPGFGAGLLDCMENWKTAAGMVRQHHETPDGAGYPEGLQGDGICPGAKLLAIADAFEAVMLKHSARGHKRSVLRAVAEVNACDNQFAPEWIEPFNSVIRRMVEQ